MLQAGKLTQRITLQAPAVTRGSSGGIVKTWSDAAVSIAAAVRNLSGNERRASSAAGGEAAQARTEFTIRWRPGITSQLRVLYAGAVYNIVHVNDFMGRRELLILTCDTGLNDG